MHAEPDGVHLSGNPGGTMGRGMGIFGPTGWTRGRFSKVRGVPEGSSFGRFMPAGLAAATILREHLLEENLEDRQNDGRSLYRMWWD